MDTHILIAVAVAAVGVLVLVFVGDRLRTGLVTAAEHGVDAPARPVEVLLAAGGELLAADPGEVLHSGREQVSLGGEVVELGAAGQPRSLGDQRGRRPRVAVLRQTLDGRFEQPGTSRTAALLLRHAGLGHRGASWAPTHKQSSLSVYVVMR